MKKIAKENGYLAKIFTKMTTIAQLVGLLNNPKLENMTKKRLEKLADERGYRRWSRLKSEGLISLLRSPLPDYEAIKEAKNEERRQRGEYTVKELIELATNAGIQVTARMRKDELIEKLEENFILSSTFSIYRTRRTVPDPRVLE